MKLYIQQKIFTWGDKFFIYDADGNQKYSVEGEVLTFGKKLHLYDVSENELIYIEQQLFTFFPRYILYRNGEKFAEVVKEFSLFHPEYTVYGPDWNVRGEFFAHEYTVVSGDTVIAAVTKEWFTLGDAYEISLNDNADEIAALAVVLVIDACLDAQRN